MLICESLTVDNTTEDGWIYETSKESKSVTAFDWKPDGNCTRLLTA